jgi:hypothetical protein
MNDLTYEFQRMVSRSSEIRESTRSHGAQAAWEPTAVLTVSINSGSGVIWASCETVLTASGRDVNQKTTIIGSRTTIP